MKVDDIPAGRELDALIAEKVMDWLCCDTLGKGIAPDSEQVEPDWYPVERIPDYSSDIRAAFEAAEQADLFRISLLTKNEDGKYIVCHPYEIGEWPDYYASASESAALAICRAALKAVGVTEVPD